MGEPSTSATREDTGFRVRRVFERRLASGEALFLEGEPGELVYVVHAGRIELTRQGPEGARLLSRKGPGELIGEMDVLLGARRSCDAHATTDSTVLELDSSTFESMCVEQPEIAIRLIQQLASRAKSLERRLEALGGDDLVRPLVRALVRRAGEGRSRASAVARSLRDLADDAGLSLVETHRALSQLVERKVVKLVEDRLEIADLDALTAAAESGA